MCVFFASYLFKKCSYAGQMFSRYQMWRVVNIPQCDRVEVASEPSTVYVSQTALSDFPTGMGLRRVIDQYNILHVGR